MLTSTADRLPRGDRLRSAPRRWSRWLGGGLILVGVCLLGSVAWQFYGTNWISHRHQAQVISELHQRWNQGDDAAVAANSSASAIVRIPRFGSDYEVPVLEGTSDEVLATGFGHFPGTAGPGEQGNFALAAHRVTHGEPLRRMPELQAGDEVIVETRDAVYTYQLDSAGDDLIVALTKGWVVEDKPRNPEPGGVEPVHGNASLLTLTTCAEIFHTDDRMVAFGHLVDVDTRH